MRCDSMVLKIEKLLLCCSQEKNDVKPESDSASYLESLKKTYFYGATGFLLELNFDLTCY